LLYLLHFFVLTHAIKYNYATDMEFFQHTDLCGGN